MAELSKYDLILEELNSLEKHFSMLSRKNKELLLKSESLELLNAQLSAENTGLNKKIAELEARLEGVIKENNSLRSNGNSLNLKDKESLKLQINELINKIDFHLRS
ncbi:MAG: hypothetical protein Q8933_17740 [Bacteroidota bacterium]|nr:hypothetical protein [Bacteroidota bacterium]MDP4193335.1 hypothetical protein [Bacteroidota bacterium]MDP4197105.1 hypothetical protein [Bacteroidota bacterium]